MDACILNDIILHIMALIQCTMQTGLAVRVITWEMGLLLTQCCGSSVGAGLACARVFLMSRAAINDSIRLFLNALVTPMGRPALECAHSAEQSLALAQHQGHSQIDYCHPHTSLYKCFCCFEIYRPNIP